MIVINKIETGKRIRELREAAAETQEELAKHLEVKRQIISYYENGTRVPNLEHLMLIACHYNTTTDYLLCLSDVPTTDKDLKFVCEYTGLSNEAVENMQSHKNNAFYTTLLNFLINNKVLLSALNNYLFSSVYSEYAKSDYMYLPLKSNSNKPVYIRNSEIAQKVAYSSLLEALPLEKEKITDEIQSNKALKEKLLFELAISAVDLGKCKQEEADIYGISDCMADEEFNEYYNSEQYEIDELQSLSSEYNEQRIELITDEEKEKKENFILWFMDELAKQKGGADNGKHN